MVQNSSTLMVVVMLKSCHMVFPNTEVASVPK